MISKNLNNVLFIIRNASLNYHMGCSFKKNRWKNLKLFHLSQCSFSEDSLLKKHEGLHLKSKYIKVWKNMTIQDLASSLRIPTRDLGLLLPHLAVKPDYKIKDFKVFDAVAEKLGKTFKLVEEPKVQKKEKELDFHQPPSKPENLVKRPPVVTVMGHIDHGKTTLLDALRNTFVVQQEFGGITQHIGAFSVEIKPGKRITFIDTPGHAAFTKMRSRGAEVTDIVVLVIAADDGVMEQTVESIRVAKAAQVRIIVAVNKIDKVNAKTIDEVKENLLLEGIQVEDKGGDIQLVPISALKKINLDFLTETILLEAEDLNLRGDPTGLVEGVVIESKKEKTGIIATIIVKRGILRKRKLLVAGKAQCRVRRMLDENGKEFFEAHPSTPVQISGWKELPNAGDEVLEVKSEKEASLLRNKMEKIEEEKKYEIDKVVIQKKMEEERQKLMEYKKTMQSLKSWKEQHKFHFDHKVKEAEEERKEDSTPVVKVILKGDVFGTLEVLLNILQSYDKDDECKLSIINASVGGIKPKDLELAEDFEALIYAFNVDIDPTAKDIIKEKNVDIRYHNVIYRLIDDLKAELSSRIPNQKEEKILGEAEVLQDFVITYASKKVHVAGARCNKGQLQKDSLYKVLRNNEIIHEGNLKVMKNEKKVVKTILKGMECGLLFDSFSDKFEPGDRIVCYDLIEVSRGSSWNPGF